MTFHYYVISRRLIIHAHANEYLGGLQLRSSYGRAATASHQRIMVFSHGPPEKQFSWADGATVPI